MPSKILISSSKELLEASRMEKDKARLSIVLIGHADSGECTRSGEQIWSNGSEDLGKSTHPCSMKHYGIIN